MESYHQLARTVLERGNTRGDRTGTGTISTFALQWRHDMADGFPLLTTKKLPPRWIFEELRWFLSGSTNEKDLAATGVDIWKEWATQEQCAKFGREEGDLGHVYGGLWRNFDAIDPNSEAHAGHEPPVGNDQIAYIVDQLENNPLSRRLIVSGWHPIHANLVALPPCHTLWQCYVEPPDNTNGTIKWRPRLSLQLYARSNQSALAA